MLRGEGGPAQGPASQPPEEGLTSSAVVERLVERRTLGQQQASHTPGGTYPEGRLSAPAFLPGSAVPLGCLGLAASKAGLFPEAEAVGSESGPPPVPDPSAAPSERTRPLGSEAADTSGTGASSPVVPV